MEPKTISEVRSTAHAKWREYRDAEKANPKEPLYTDLKKMYWQMKHGKVLMDIREVISAAGVHPHNSHPKLAIAQVGYKKVFCTYEETGTVIYRVQADRWYDKTNKETVYAQLPPITNVSHLHRRAWDGVVRRFNNIQLEAPLPLIPPKCRPKVLTEDHYILWEVDVWEPVAPVDPYLLRRITPTIFAVEAQWDLTEVERAAMNGRLR